MSPPEPELSRRSILKTGATTAAVVGVGVPAFSGTALATACPRTPGYWKNHDWPDGTPSGLQQVNDNLGEAGLALSFDTVGEGQEFLNEPTRGDKGRILLKHFIATTLNYQFRRPGDACVSTPVVDVDGDGTKESVNTINTYVKNWLAESGWTEGTSVRSWYIPTATVPDGEVLKDALDDWNNNRFDVDGCPC